MSAGISLSTQTAHFLTLWREVERLESAVEVERAAARWLDGWRRKRSEV